ncbi:hypothetical protein KC921_02950 [Candidatus Woesebacteria bacterium]|nr:hypothetical protein [Candidatus Woesebacteria bacterium]
MNSPLAFLSGNILNDPSLLLTGFVKLLLIFGGILYALFALLVIRQIQLMRSTVQTSFSSIMILVGLAHFVLAVLVVLYFLTL